MVDTTFKALKGKYDPAVLTGLDLLVCVRKWSPGAPYIPTSLVSTTGVLQALPAGWVTVGEMQQKAGLDLTPNTKTSNIDGYGSQPSRRVVVTGEEFTVDYFAQEWRKVNQEMYYGTDLTGVVVNPTSGEWRGRKQSNNTLQYYSALVIAYDGMPSAELYPFWIYPKVAVTKRGKQSMQIGSEIGFPCTLSIFDDGDYGSLFDFGVAGPGMLTIAPKTGFTVPTNEIQLVTITGVPTAGTFTLSFGGQTTTAITFNAAASAVQTALVALSTIGTGNVTVTGSTGGPYTATFGGTLGNTNVAQMTADGTLLTGGTTPSVVVTTTTQGSP